MAIIALRDVKTEEQSELREMVAAYHTEQLPDALVARDPRRAAMEDASREASRVVRLTDPEEGQARVSRLADSPEAPVVRFDWIWSYDAERAMAAG